MNASVLIEHLSELYNISTSYKLQIIALRYIIIINKLYINKYTNLENFEIAFPLPSLEIQTKRNEAKYLQAIEIYKVQSIIIIFLILTILDFIFYLAHTIGSYL